MASLIVFALKNIQAKHVIINVMRILKIILSDEKFKPNSNSSMLFRFLFNNNKGIKYSALINPQAINVQLAPCQNPLTKKMIKVFLTLNHFEPLLPPSGMYK